MALLFSLLWKVAYYGVTIGKILVVIISAYPALKAHESISENRTEKLWIVYFLIMGLLSMLQYTLLYPIVFM